MGGILVADGEGNVQQFKRRIFHQFLCFLNPHLENIVPHGDIHLLFEEKTEIVWMETEPGGNVCQHKRFGVMLIDISPGLFYNISIIFCLLDF